MTLEMLDILAAPDEGCGGLPGVHGAFLVEDMVVELPDRVGFVEGFEGQKGAVKEYES
jgi:hypothetical protein